MNYTFLRLLLPFSADPTGDATQLLLDKLMIFLFQSRRRGARMTQVRRAIFSMSRSRDNELMTETPAERSARKHRELQAQILALPGTERVLRKLKRAGANRERVLSLVADTVHDKTFWLAPVRRQKKTLEDLANDLETLATRAERVSLDPLSYTTLWLAML